jgi:hypothetical protein
LIQILAKRCDVDVLGKAIDEAVRFRQGRSALKQQTGTTRWESMIKDIESPADSEIFLDILRVRAEATRRGKECVEAVPFGC